VISSGEPLSPFEHILDAWSATRKLARRRVRKRLGGALHLDLTQQLVTDDVVLID